MIKVNHNVTFSASEKRHPSNIIKQIISTIDLKKNVKTEKVMIVIKQNILIVNMTGRLTCL